MKSNFLQPDLSFIKKNHNNTNKYTNNSIFTLLTKRINILNNIYYSQLTSQQYNIDINLHFDLPYKAFKDLDLTQIEPDQFCTQRIANTPSTTSYYSYLNLPEKYESSSLVLRKIKYLREALSDGDSYYRSFIYKYFQQIIASNTTSLLKRHIQSMKNLLKNCKPFTLRDKKVNLNNVLSIFNVLLCDMIKRRDSKNNSEKDKVENLISTLQFFDKAFNNDNDFHFGLVKYVKLAISDYIKTKSFYGLDRRRIIGLINPKYIITESILDQEEYIKDNIEQMQTCPSMLIVYFTALAFNCTISLFIEENNCIMKKQFNYNKETYNFNLITISILYSNHKYDLAYTDSNSDNIVLNQFNEFLISKAGNDNMLGIVNLYKSHKSASSSDTRANSVSSNSSDNDSKIGSVLIKEINEELNQRIACFYSDLNCNFEYYCSPIKLNFNLNCDDNRSITIYDKDIYDLRELGYIKTNSIREQMLYLMNKKCLICTSESGHNEFPSKNNTSLCDHCYNLAKEFYNHS